jgi:hypothetical protein
MFQQQSLCIKDTMVEMFILSSPTLVIQHMPDIITKNQGWQIELASLLKNTPKDAFQKLHVHQWYQRLRHT